MTIEEIKQLVNQRIIENYTGDITAEDVNRILNETLGNIGKQETNLIELAQELTSFKSAFSLVASLFEDAVFARDRSADVARLKAMFNDDTSAVCGVALCGVAVCGNS